MRRCLKVSTAELNGWFLMGASKMRYGYNLNIIRMRMVILGWGEPQRRNGFHPALLWSDCGGQCPELQKLATQILSQTCYGALRYKPKRGLDENLLTKGRNSAEQECLYDPMFVHYRCIQCQLGGIMKRWMLLLRLTFWLMV